VETGSNGDGERAKTPGRQRRTTTPPAGAPVLNPKAATPSLAAIASGGLFCFVLVESHRRHPLPRCDREWRVVLFCSSRHPQLPPPPSLQSRVEGCFVLFSSTLTAATPLPRCNREWRVAFFRSSRHSLPPPPPSFLIRDGGVPLLLSDASTPLPRSKHEREGFPLFLVPQLPHPRPKCECVG
jgi:hypothetical protein